jgi:hypothetical protein
MHVLILGALVAFLGGMLALQSVRRAWLERLVAAIIRSVVLLFLLALVVVVTIIAVIAILPLVVVTMIHVALPVVAIITHFTLFRDMVDLLIASLPERMMHLTSHAILDLMLVFLRSKLKMFLKYFATDSSILSLRQCLLSTYFARSSEWKDI